MRILLLLLFLFPSSIQADIPVKSYFDNHFAGTERLWDMRMGQFSQNELKQFVKATWIGTEGNVACCKALSAISILECGPNRRLRDKYGHLGGHLKTIKLGAKECKIRANTPYERELALSRRFLILYYHYGMNMERTCKEWNQGEHWKNHRAEIYWEGVLSFEKIYN